MNNRKVIMYICIAFKFTIQDATPLIPWNLGLRFSPVSGILLALSVRQKKSTTVGAFSTTLNGPAPFFWIVAVPLASAVAN